MALVHELTMKNKLMEDQVSTSKTIMQKLERELNEKTRFVILAATPPNVAAGTITKTLAALTQPSQDVQELRRIV
jgi:hypothetical protein